MFFCKTMAIAFLSSIALYSAVAEDKKIEDIDKNFTVAKVGNREVKYFDALKPPFALEGFAWFGKDKKLYRLPSELTKDQVNSGALFLSNHTSGGAIRFRTDSPYIVLKATLVHSSDMNHMTRTGSAGFDIYRGTPGNMSHAGTAQVGRDQKTLELVIAGTPDKTMQDWLLNMPLYGGVSTLEIGIAPDTQVEAPTPHKTKAPVLFYGSSITQGGCASRPGNAYTSMLCRAVDAEQINLGFSGSGRGEPAVAKAIADLKLSAFVMDYDHNAPSVKHLEETHEQFFKIIRQQQPELPIIIMTKCDNWGSAADAQRRDVIRKTYENALSAGDRNVYFIDGATLFGTENRDACTVDRCHPNDLGFYRMYQTCLPVLKKALKQD